MYLFGNLTNYYETCDVLRVWYLDNIFVCGELTHKDLKTAFK